MPTFSNMKIKFLTVLLTLSNDSSKTFDFVVLSSGMVPVYDCIHNSQKWVLLVHIFTYCIVLQIMCSKLHQKRCCDFNKVRFFFQSFVFGKIFKISNDTESNTEFTCLTFFLHPGLPVIHLLFWLCCVTLGIK